MKTVIAVDLGAESGRVMAVHYDGHHFELEELTRFENPVVEIHHTLYWDVLHLWRNIQNGIALAKPYRPLSIGVDTWAVDFALLDESGNLLGNPVMYRDKRTDGMMQRVFERIPQREVFARTGIQFMPINTLYQMMSLVETNAPILKQAHTFLTIPDLLNYWLTGRKVCEFTNATTTQMLNPQTRTWDAEMLGQLGIPAHILPEVVPAGTVLGNYKGIPVIAPATHDTGSSVIGVPTQTDNYAYISSGTWSLVGLEVPHAILSDEAYNANVTNEGGFDNTYRLLKNVMGLWILQQCRATWQAQGHTYSYDELVKLAEYSPAMAHHFDVDDAVFLSAGDHPSRIQSWFTQRALNAPQTHGAIIRAVLESLALKYRYIIHDLERIAGKSIEVLHIVGGGTQNHLLNQFTADAIGKPVITGPIESTVIGNAIVQFMALGVINHLSEARGKIVNMNVTQTYQPQQTSYWESSPLSQFNHNLSIAEED
jgi:rhamnulokinase